MNKKDYFYIIEPHKKCEFFAFGCTNREVDELINRYKTYYPSPKVVYFEKFINVGYEVEQKVKQRFSSSVCRNGISELLWSEVKYNDVIDYVESIEFDDQYSICTGIASEAETIIDTRTHSYDIKDLLFNISNDIDEKKTPRLNLTEPLKKFLDKFINHIKVLKLSFLKKQLLNALVKKIRDKLYNVFSDRKDIISIVYMELRARYTCLKTENIQEYDIELLDSIWNNWIPSKIHNTSILSAAQFISQFTDGKYNTLQHYQICIDEYYQYGYIKQKYVFQLYYDATKISQRRLGRNTFYRELSKIALLNKGRLYIDLCIKE